MVMHSIIMFNAILMKDFRLISFHLISNLLKIFLIFMNFQKNLFIYIFNLIHDEDSFIIKIIFQYFIFQLKKVMILFHFFLLNYVKILLIN